MSWSENDMDQLFRNAEAQQEFTYDPQFFDEIERELPVKRSRKALAWWISSFVMFVLFSLLFFTPLNDGLVSDSNTEHKVLTSGSKVNNALSLSEAQEQIEHPEILNNKEENSSVTTAGVLKIETIEVVSLPEEIEQQSMIPEQSVLPNEQITLKYLELDQVKKSDAEMMLFPVSTMKRKIRASWYVALDGGVQQSWTDESTGMKMNGLTALSSGVDVHLGRWQVGAGLSFTWQNLNHLEIRERTKIYGFGYSTYDNAYSFTGVANLSVPLRVGFTKGRHQWIAGLDAGRNLFSSLRRVQSMNGEVFRMTQGITDVSLLNKYSLQPQLGYAYQINEQMTIGVNVKYQALHPLASDRFEGEQNQHPWSAGITLKAALTK